jgi:hypothetical protein
MSLLAVPIIAVAALVIAFFCIIIFISVMRANKKALIVLQNQVQASNILIDELQAANEQFKSGFGAHVNKFEQFSLENIQVSKQLEHRIKVMQGLVASQQDQITQLQEQQPEDKLYSRAFKLAALGADINEIMQECELPRAEAEMLMSVYQKKIRS